MPTCERRATVHLPLIQGFLSRSLLNPSDLKIRAEVAQRELGIKHRVASTVVTLEDIRLSQLECDRQSDHPPRFFWMKMNTRDLGNVPPRVSGLNFKEEEKVAPSRPVFLFYFFIITAGLSRTLAVGAGCSPRRRPRGASRTATPTA